MCFQTKPTGFSENKYFRRNKGFAGNTRYWKQGKSSDESQPEGRYVEEREVMATSSEESKVKGKRVAEKEIESQREDRGEGGYG